MSLVGGREKGCAHAPRVCDVARRGQSGFTLIEVMVTVAIIGILAAIAYPSYTDYVLRGRLVDATNALSATRTRMEQHYQDNRTYESFKSAEGKTIVSPCLQTQSAGTFKLTCEKALTSSTYTITATGSGSTSGFEFTINEKNDQFTTKLLPRWGTVPSSGCRGWIVKKGQACE